MFVCLLVCLLVRFLDCLFVLSSGLVCLSTSFCLLACLLVCLSVCLSVCLFPVFNCSLHKRFVPLIVALVVCSFA